MFEKRSTRIKNLARKNFDFSSVNKNINNKFYVGDYSPPSHHSTGEHNMTRKTRTRRIKIPSAAFHSGFCTICHRSYISLQDHIQSRKHIKLIGDDANFISLKGFDDQDSNLESFLALDSIDALEVIKPNCEDPYLNRNTPRTRTRALDIQRKESSASPEAPVHHLRSRKNINYMTPPLDEDSLTEELEEDKDFKELRTSSRILEKLSDIKENDTVWSSGRPKRACNRQRYSADERLVADNKSYYKVDVLPSKLRSGVAPFQSEIDRGLNIPLNHGRRKNRNVIKRKTRNSEVSRLNNEAENFLFPKKEVSSEDEEVETAHTEKSPNVINNFCPVPDVVTCTRIKVEDEDSIFSTFSETKGKKRRRTHAEAFIMDNQKYYKFETPGSRLRYQGTYLPSVGTKAKANGKFTDEDANAPTENDFRLQLDDYKFSFERVPRSEMWYRTFQRKDKGEEKYALLSDDNYWNSLILPYQLEYVLPLNPQDCISQYNLIKKCLMEPGSTSSSGSCNTPDPNATSNSTTSSVEPPFLHDEDSKLSSTMTDVSSVSTLDDFKPASSQRAKVSKGGRNPRKSPRQHASTLAILSSLIQQRKRKSRVDNNSTLPTILEEPKPTKSTKPHPSKIDFFSMAHNIEEEFALACNDFELEPEIGRGGIDFRSRVSIADLFFVKGQSEEKKDTSRGVKSVIVSKVGRKPGRKKKKNRTGWPNPYRRIRRVKEEDESTIDSVSEENVDVCEGKISTDSIKKGVSVNNNKRDQSKLSGVKASKVKKCQIDRTRVETRKNNCARKNSSSPEKILTSKVNNSDSLKAGLRYQPYVRVQKLDKNHLDSKEVKEERSNSPKRTNRGRRRMPASPRSPRMLRRPRGRWYRER